MILLLFAMMLGSSSPSGLASQSQPSRPPNLLETDEVLAQIGENIPVFGGAFVDEDGRLNLWLTEASDGAAAAVVTALDQVSDENLSALNYVVIDAEYSFLELKRWQDALKDIHTLIPGLVFTYIDDVRNMITIGVEGTTRDRSDLDTELARLEVPVEAVRLEESAPIRPVLRDRHRPLRGGFQIQYQTGAFGLGTDTCTLGFTAGRGTTMSMAI